MRASADLKERWLAAKEQWTDGTSQKFEEDYLHALGPLLSQVMAAVGKYRDLITEAEQECSDPDRPHD